MQSCLQRLAEGRKARRITLFKNGDRFDRGLRYALSADKVRTFEALLEDLTRIMGDLPLGVRFIFSVDGQVRVSQLEQLREGGVYVCSSKNHLVQLPYGRQGPPRPLWNMGSRPRCIQGTASTAATSHPPSSHRVRSKLITVIRHGVSPEVAVQHLVDEITAGSFRQVMDDIRRKLRMASGALRKIDTFCGTPVTSLEDFFGSDRLYVAYGAEECFMDDNCTGKVEWNGINGHSQLRRKTRFFSAPPKSPLSDQTSQLNVHRSPSKSTKPTTKLHPVALPEMVARLYHLREMLGEGNFSSVFHCISRKSCEEYALKVVDKGKCKGSAQLLANEVAILRKVKHPNIVRLVEDFDVGSELYLVMELVKGGDLHGVIAKVRKFSEAVASRLVGDLARGLAYLHDLRVVHRDIKPENLLLSFGGMLKLADFGLATELPADGSLLLAVCGTPEFLAPEILAETGYGQQVDVWAMGVVTYILLCGFRPFDSEANDQEEVFYQIIHGQFDFSSPCWNGVSATARELIQGLLEVDVALRLTAMQVLTHPWHQKWWHAADWERDPWQVGLHFQRRRRSSPESSVPLSLS